MRTRKNATEGVLSAPSAATFETEVWKDIPGYGNRYQASNFVGIKSLQRKVRSVNHYSGKEFLRTVPERILRPASYCKSGHLSVVLEHGGIGKPVHQLIMKAFVGDPPDGMEVLHNNGNPTDNRFENLRYGTRTDNILDVYRQGGRWRKLSADDVAAIKFSLFCGFKGIDLAQEYGVSQQVISSIKHRRTFKWLK